MLTLLMGGNSRDGAISRAGKTQALPFTVMATKACFVTTNRGPNRYIQLSSFIYIAIELTAATGWQTPHIQWYGVDTCTNSNDLLKDHEEDLLGIIYGAIYNVNLGIKSDFL